jgi:hypothetical protein
MAFNPSPKVAAARDIGAKFGKDQVIVLMIDSKTGTLEYASYGATRELCADAKRRADAAYDAVIVSYSKCPGPGWKK